MADKTITAKWKGLLQKHRNDIHEETGARVQFNRKAPKLQSTRKRPSAFVERYQATTKALDGNDISKGFVATKKSNGEMVAVKRSNPKIVSSRRISAEFRIGCHLRHDNIIQNIELLSETDGHWLHVMEYAPNNLFDRATAGQMSMSEIECSFVQVARGLEYMHYQGIAHRDLKLENVVYTDSGIMKIIDFGVAAICRNDDDGRLRYSTDSVGCRPYMAPELIACKPYNPKSADVWSLAIMLCCLVLERFPWQVASMGDKAYNRFVRYMSVKHGHQILVEQSPNAKNCCATEKVGPISKEASDVNLRERLLSRKLSEDAWMVVEKMLEIDPSLRPDTIGILQNDWIRGIETCYCAGEGAVGTSCGHTHI